MIASSIFPTATGATTGDPASYPEFPYPHTNYDEPLRGQYHFSPRAGWMNDINAPLYYRGTYHVFFQHNPHSLAWDTMHWGHATSPDLVHWTQKPIALEPGVHPGDLWSGGGVVDTANTSGLRSGTDDPIVVFTGTNGVRAMYSTDGAKTFQPYDGGRVLVTPPGTSRDPKVFWHAATQRWVMAVWVDDNGTGVRFYTSPNLLDWTYRSRYDAGWLVECPDLVALPVDGDPADVRWVLSDASGEYVVGSFDGSTFSTTWAGPQRMDHGRNDFHGTFYGGLTFENMPNGRVVQMVWQPGNHGSTWTGNASFPATLGLRTYPEGVRVTRNPVAELSTLRTGTRSWTNSTVTTDPGSNPLAGIAADSYELIAEFDVAGASADRFGFRLNARDAGGFDRAIVYDRATGLLDGVPVPAESGRVRLRVLVDRGQVEIFGNDGRSSTTDNVNFTASGNQGIQAFAEGGSVRLTSLTFHRLSSAWGWGESTLESNLAGPWRAVRGTWTDESAGKRGAASGGDGFYLSNQQATDLTYEADVRPDSAGAAAGITFRAAADASTHYTANVDTAGLVKLWRPGRDIAVSPAPIQPGQTYHLKVVAQGSNLEVYLDGALVIDATDTAYAGGLLGLNVFNGSAVIQNPRIS